MSVKDTLFHINWGDGDDCFIVAPDEATARERMLDGRDMVNYVVRLDHLYQLIFKAGIKEVVAKLDEIDRDADDVRDFTRRVCALIVEYQAKLKEWGVKDGR